MRIKILILLTSLFLVVISLTGQSVYTPGTHNDWTLDGDNEASLKSNLGGVSYYGVTIQPSENDEFKIVYVASGGNVDFTNNWGAGYWIPGSGNLNADWSIASDGGNAIWKGDNISQLDSYVHLVIKDPENSTGSSLSVGIMTLSAAPVTLSSTTNTSTASLGDTHTISTTLSTTPSAEEHFYLRYTDDNWSTSTIAEMTVSTSTASYDLAFTSTGTYQYYAFSSTVDLTGITATSDKDILTINYDNNSGSNYEVTVSTIDAATSFTATADGSVGHEEIDLSWTLNGSSNDVIVVASTVQSPDELTQGSSYSQGDGDLGTAAGKVIYKGGATSFSHTGLAASTTHYYKAFSVNGSDYYSSASTASASTDAAPTTLAASVGTAMTEANLDGTVITLTLSGDTFADATLDAGNFELQNVPIGTTKASVSYTSTTEATVTLSYDGTDFDSDFTAANVRILATELSGSVNLTSSNLTITANDDAEAFTIAWADTPGTDGAEATMDDEVVRLTLTGGQFISGQVNATNITAAGTATSSGVSIESVSYVNESTVDVVLAWDGTDYDSDLTLTLTVVGDAYNEGTATLQDDITLTATDEPDYVVSLSDLSATFLDELTIVFEDEKPAAPFYSDGQSFIFMEIALRIDGTDWQYQKYLSRDVDETILLDGSNDDIKLTQVGDTYQITFDPVSFFSSVPDETTVEGFNVIFFNQYHDDDSSDPNNDNNITSTLFIDLVDDTYYTTFLTPTIPASDEALTVTFDARGTALEGASKVYFHSGIALDGPGSTSFDIAIGNWGADDGLGEMTQVSGTETWEIDLTSIADYYSLPTDENAFRLNCLFRSADGSVKEDNEGANFSKELDPGNYVLIDTPDYDPFVTETSTDFTISATANASVDWTLEEVGDPNLEISTASAQTTFSHVHQVTTASSHDFIISADFGGGDIRTRTFSVEGYSSIVDESRPAGTIAGINYNESDDTEVTLVLHTPTSTDYSKDGTNVTGTSSTAAKSVVHVIGDFNNWEISDSYKMKRDGDYWWITLTGLTAGQDYVFQYLVDGEIRIGDPYTNQVSDSEDQYIDAGVYSGLPTYPSDKTSGRASVINTQQPEYVWEVTDFTPASINDLNIYEMHFRDFTDEGTYLAAIDKLDYIKELGINAIHVMPVSEFEGNSSWGYNPNYYLAADKAYGKPNDLKQFIDEAHKRDIAVFNDIVFNHAFGSNPMVLLYWDDVNSQPSSDNPWFNAEHKAVYDEAGHWGNDWNHESEHTQAFVDRTLDYWLNEFNFDGFRFDFTKGFTQTAPDANDPWASSDDTDRQTILKRMVDAMKANKSGAVAIFEHLANATEDKVLADYGILMWSGVGHHDKVKELNLGFTDSDKDIYTTGIYNSSQWDFQFANLVSYAESHDEERQAYELLTYGNVVKDIADAGDQLAFAVERLKGGLALNLMMPGPRMLWQFEELAYDYSIDYNGRTGEKPVKWDYFDDSDRKELYTLASQLLYARQEYSWYATTPDYGTLGNTTGFDVRRMELDDDSGHYMIIISNPDPENAATANFSYPVQATWYQNNGDINYKNLEFTVDGTNVNSGFGLAAGQTMVLTNVKLTVPSDDDDGDGVTNIYDQCADTPAGATVDADGCIIKDTQSITFDNIPAQNLFDGSLTLTASASSGLDISYVSSDTNIATISGSVVTFLQAGTVTITASQAGDIYYEVAADVDNDLEIIEQYIWDGSVWNSGSAPPSDKDVQFDGDYTLSSDMETASVYVSSGATLTVAAGTALVDNNEVYNDGTIVVESGGQLITLGSVFGTGYQIARETTFDESTGKYSIVGSPISSASFSVLGASAIVYGYDESELYNPSGNEGLDRFKTPTELVQTTMQSGQGYFTAFIGDADGKVIFAGTPNTGTVDVSLSYTDQGTTEEEDYEGFNLVSNPYPAAIDGDAFLTANSSVIDETIYLWDDYGSETARGTNADYLVYNKTLGTTDSRAGGDSKWDGYIRSGQGFFVKTSAGGTLTFTDALKDPANVNSDGGYFRVAPVTRYKIVIVSESFQKAAIVGFVEDATSRHDPAYDALSMSGEGLSVYTREEGGRKLAIQGLPIDYQEPVTLGFSASEGGLHTIRLANLEENQPGYVLIDRYMNKQVDLTRNSYSFMTEVGVFEDRFILTAPETITGLDNLAEIRVSGIDGTLRLFSDQMIDAGTTYRLVDLMGKIITSGTVESAGKVVTIPVPDAYKTVYLLQLQQGNKSWSGKVVIH